MANDVMTTFLELCDPFRQAISSLPSVQDWHYISHLSKFHGVTPFLFYRTQQLEVPIPQEIRKEWLAYYLYQIAGEQRARRQIKELKEILDPAGVPFILLKGASAMLRLYPEPGLRAFCDIDILIPIDKIGRFKGAIVGVGYKPLSARNSREDEELQKFDVHLDPLWKDGSLMVEAHLNILGVKGDHSAANCDVWEGRKGICTDETNVEHLNAEYFIAHTLLHYSKHLSNEGFGEIKWLIDLLYAERGWSVDWSKVMDIACRWGIEKEIFPVMATLNHYWQTEIPVATEVAPFDFQTVVLGIKDREKQFYAKLPESYIDRFLQFRKLPHGASQFRYILHLFFPTQKNLRWRYSLSSKWSIMPYYFVHIIYTCKKFFTGFWYQILYGVSRNLII